ncbi:MAG TPA: hypothetical protein VI588_02700, partial [Candidatus Gracilibacteria bacterium]|nr:hypothetical protein [Candidatus Gracilibacteria bacterium]
AHIGLGQIAMLKNDDGKKDREIQNHFHAALKADVRVQEAHMGLAGSYFAAEDDARAELHFEKGAQLSNSPDDAQKYIRALREIFNPTSTSHQNRAVENLCVLAEKGHGDSIRLLMQYFARSGQRKNLINCVELAIKYGDLKAYLKLGELHLNEGDTEASQKAYEMAFKAGYLEACLALTMLLLQEGKDIEKAEAVCQQAIDAGVPEGYLGMSAIMGYQGKTMEAIGPLLSKAIEAGIKLPLEMVVPVLIMEKQYKKALDLCKAEQASNPKALFFMSIIMSELGNQKAADKHLDDLCRSLNMMDEWRAAQQLMKERKKTEAVQAYFNLFYRIFAELGVTAEQGEAMAKQYLVRKLN